MRKRSEVVRTPEPQQPPPPVLIEGQVCERCFGPVFSTPSGVLCEQCGGGVETLPMPVTAPVKSPDKVPATPHEEPKAKTSDNPVHAVFGAHSLPSNKSMNAALDMAPLDRIVTTIFDCDIDRVYERLKRELKVGEGRADRGTLQKNIDEAEDNAREAHRLYVTAKLMKERYEAQHDPIIGAMWKSAQEVLEKEKKDGLRTKQITDADVRYKAAEMYPDEWQEQQARLRKYDQTVKHLEHLVQLWISRCQSTRKLSDLVR